MPKASFTRKELATLACAIGDGIRDREAMVYAYTFPSYVKVDAGARTARRKAVNTVRRYRTLLAKVRHMARPAGAEASGLGDAADTREGA